MKKYSKKQNSQKIVLISKVLISAFLFLIFTTHQAFAGSSLNDFYTTLNNRTLNPSSVNPNSIDSSSNSYISPEHAEKGKIWGNYLYYTDPKKYNPTKLQELLKSGGVERIRQEVATKYNSDTDSIVNNCKSFRFYAYCNIADTVTNIVHSLKNTARDSYGKYCSQKECNEYCSNALLSGTEATGYKFLGSCSIENQSTTDRSRSPFCSSKDCNMSCRNALFIGSAFKGCSPEFRQTDPRATRFCTPNQCSENCSNAIFGSTNDRDRILMYCAQTKLPYCTPEKCNEYCSNAKFGTKNGRGRILIFCEQTNEAKRINLKQFGGIGNLNVGGL